MDAIRPRNRHHDGRKVAVVGGYGDVGKGSAESLRGSDARVIVTKSIRSAPAGAHGRIPKVKRMIGAVKSDIIVTASVAT